MGRSGVRRTHEEFLKELEEINPDIEVLGVYSKAHDKILVKCKIHNYEYYSKPNNLLLGKKCKFCKIDKVRESRKKNFCEIESEFSNRGYVLLSTEDEIQSLSRDKLRYLCPKHGEKFILWGNFQQGEVCKDCAYEEKGLATKKITWNKIVERFRNSEYDLVSTFDDYTSSRESCLRCICKEHGEFKISWNNFQKFEGCPMCKASLGERKIIYCLNNMCIDFEYQYSFDDLLGTGGKKLSYDFYISKYNLLIEYQGEQHDHPVEFNGIDKDTAYVNFIKQKTHDDRKRHYAKDNSYQLLEIWYYDFKNIENILKNQFTAQN